MCEVSGICVGLSLRKYYICCMLECQEVNVCCWLEWQEKTYTAEMHIDETLCTNYLLRILFEHALLDFRITCPGILAQNSLSCIIHFQHCNLCFGKFILTCVIKELNVAVMICIIILMISIIITSSVYMSFAAWTAAIVISVSVQTCYTSTNQEYCRES